MGGILAPKYQLIPIPCRIFGGTKFDARQEALIPNIILPPDGVKWHFYNPSQMSFILPKSLTCLFLSSSLFLSPSLSTSTLSLSLSLPLLLPLPHSIFFLSAFFVHVVFQVVFYYKIQRKTDMRFFI